MISLNDITEHDIHQWLNGGWIDVNGTVKKYHSVVGDVIRVYNDAETDLEDYPVSECRAHWPQCGAVNVDGYAVVITRSSRQQYRRTYNSRVLTTDLPRKWDVMKALGTQIAHRPDDAGLVQAAFRPRYFAYAEALQQLDMGWVTCAMTPYLVLAGNSEEHLLYYRGTLVGTISGSELTPIGDDPRTVTRLLKFFDGRITVCMSEISQITEETLSQEPGSVSVSS